MLRRNEKVEWIKHAPLFANLSKRDLAEVAHLADELDLREGKEMTRQGAPAREFFVLLEGEADVRKNGRRINQLGPGDFFGEIALVSNVPRTASVTTTSPVRALVVSSRDFWTLLDESPTTQRKILETVGDRLAKHDES